MVEKIITSEEAIKISKQIQTAGKKIVLVGGCFDILHIGHITFLEEAKKQGDVLFVLLEADETIIKTKGPTRPINTQQDRAKILTHLTIVDFVISLPPFVDNNAYDMLINQLKPAIIATTAGDPYRSHKERQAKLIGANVVDVLEPISNKSTTKLIAMLEEL